MLKKLIIILILLITIFCSLKIYKSTIESKVPYVYEYPFKPYGYICDELVYDDDFNLSDVLYVLSNEFQYDYHHDDDYIFLDINNHNGSVKLKFPYLKKVMEDPKEVEYIYITNTIKQPSENNSERIDNNPIPVIKPQNQPYFSGYHDIEISVSSSIRDLISLLSKDIRTSVQVNVDYSDVNLNEVGVYLVVYHTEIGDYQINVKVY